jgi:GH15 family glucan-1,4-alpha-glucosidase
MTNKQKQEVIQSLKHYAADRFIETTDFWKQWHDILNNFVEDKLNDPKRS